jgi:serine protease
LADQEIGPMKNRLMLLNAAIVAATFLISFHASAEPELIPRRSAEKPSILHSSPSARITHIAVKFHEGTAIRIRDGKFVTMERSARETNRLQALSLDSRQADVDAAAATDLVARTTEVTRVRPLFTFDEDRLAQLRREGEARSGRELADLSLYYRLDVRPGTTSDAMADTVAALNALPSVEIAYVPIMGGPAAADIPPTTPLFESQQGYLDPASAGGIDARYAWTIAGGKGQNVKVIDVENGWRTSHEDLPALFYNNSYGSLTSANHGTAVLGVLGAVDNAYGMTGIANQAQLGIDYAGSGPDTEIADSIVRATAAVGVGGVILIEQNLFTAITGGSCGCWGCAAPVEYTQPGYDAIVAATSSGRIVIEPAGNGGQNLDNSLSRFTDPSQNSGAIMVGANESGTSTQKTCFSNYGARVDVNSWGLNVRSLGYGDLFHTYPTSDPNQEYTAAFSGTSSASAIIAGAASAAQGVSLAHGLGALDSPGMRTLLKFSGADAYPIGAQPNLRRAIDDYLSPPTADFLVSCSGNRTCVFNSVISSDNYGIRSNQWWFGDGTTAGPTTGLSHTYPRTGIFYVRLKVWDNAGRTSEITKAVTVT